MGVYLGIIGQIELTRKSTAGGKESVVNPSDVNADRDRFSFDFEEGYLITGDLAEITTTDGTNLDFVAASGWANNTVQPSGNWYVFVDELGGIKLYDTFANSLNGDATGLIPLAAIARDIPILVTIRDRDSRIIGSVVDYELNTNRETVDITALSDEYRQQYSSLISGSGRLTAHWDYIDATGKEPINYLMQLILRTEIGSSFHGKFYIKPENASAASGTFNGSQVNDAIWWEFDALITSSAASFSTSSIITGTIDFIATGPIKLRVSTRPTDYLLQEDDFKIELEQDSSSYILLEEPE